jgi:hypothetical protein
MRYVSANRDTPVLKVFGTITDPDGPDVNYAIMEFIEGQRLDTTWPGLSISEQEDVTSQLKAAVNSMRLTPHPGFISSVGRQKCIDGVFNTGKAYEPELNGPFATEADMNEGILRCVA